MGYCYKNTPEHLERFGKVEAANPYYRIAVLENRVEELEANVARDDAGST